MSVGAGAQHVGRSLNRMWGTPLPRDGSGPDWVKWWERPKSPETLLTEKQGSPRRRERAGSEAAGKEAWAAQSYMGPPGHQLDGDESPCRELGNAQPRGGLCLVEITAPLPWGVLRGRPRSCLPAPTLLTVEPELGVVSGQRFRQ